MNCVLRKTFHSSAIVLVESLQEPWTVHVPMRFLINNGNYLIDINTQSRERSNYPEDGLTPKTFGFLLFKEFLALQILVIFT